MRCINSDFIIACSTSRCADRNAVDPQCRLANADGYGLAVLTASANAIIELKIVADHRYAVQVGQSVADQHRAFDRRTYLAVLDAVSLGALEHIFARGD